MNSDRMKVLLHIKSRGQYMVNAFSNHKKLVMFLVFISFGAYADNGTAWDLDNLQAQRTLYEAKAALNKAKAEAENRENGVAANTNTFSNGGVQVSNVPAGDALPQLVKINGRNAVISMPEGNTTTVTAGQLLPGGRWQVLSIGLGGVKVKNIATQRTQIIN
ncbi:type IV pilus biogenesis protein PilP [Salmonella enterica]|uniref:Type IV pilus biogenesis protein PilP n=2 Tax=Salmonella enterica TaxID=28901 RepID=A0A5T8BSD1_SALER|nr:type IV pilus biogenesis protein PilP [Salmonella enterica]EAV6083358.1 type IV pilus biogenesis protein PilP [Salmonella enterica subsp. enterica serovar Braenderup]ECB9073051.1 type IV pilus biogenesis protein PilP [Salmonella enterica subsp. enterica serovar Thompson]ECF5817088.1 type IV pilus biogenesis protein PilP [Salmonella enterica subsp. arizonae]ECO1204517.1 type IV pilus biogenesis protein PilP [Salmonella enterica subsp. enterica serovar Heidelberg]ECS9339292.1 type IV pilus bi